MLLGITIKPFMLVGGGSALFVLMVFQILQGMRKIKFKGKLHLKVHKWVALATLAGSVFHGLFALAYLNII
ncbi:MAG: hypothetical protein AAGU73_10555 [Actinomycetota bacterium]